MPFGATNSLSVVRFHEISNPYHTRGAWPVDTASTDVNMTCLGSRLASSSSSSLSLSLSLSLCVSLFFARLAIFLVVQPSLR